MTEMEFEEVFKRALEIQTHRFTSKEASKMNQLAVSFGDGSYNELTLTEAAYVLNATSMDMSGRYIESGFLLVKDYYIENIALREEEYSPIREINDYIFVCQNDFTYSNEEIDDIFFIDRDSIIIFKDYAIEKLSKEVISLAIDAGDRFVWTSDYACLVMFEIPTEFDIGYPDIATDLTKHWDFLLDKFNLIGSKFIDQFIKNSGVETDEEFYFYKRNFIKEVMIDFLNYISSNEEWVLMFNKVLLEEDDEGFINLMRDVKTMGFSRYEFIYWWTFHRPESFLGIETACLNKVNKVLDDLVSQNRIETINSLLSGDREIFNEIKEEFPILSQQDFLDFDIDYEDFIEYYIDCHYALRYLFSLSGVRFIDDEDENEEFDMYL